MSSHQESLTFTFPLTVCSKQCRLFLLCALEFFQTLPIIQLQCHIYIFVICYTHISLLHAQNMYEFPIAIIINHHKFSDLKQYQCILLHFWRSEVWNRFNWIKVKVSAVLIPSGGSRGNSIFIYLFIYAFFSF